MDDSAVRNYFLQPPCPSHRRYEAPRAVFVDGISQKDAARRFGYSYGAFRLLVLQLRSAFPAGATPPFSTDPQEAVRPASSRKGPLTPTSRPSPTPAA